MPLQDVIEKSKGLRQDNKTLKLLKLIWQNPGIARRDIGTLAKLSRGTVTTNIAQLIEEGYVTEGEALPENATRPGRATTGLYLVPDFFYSVGVSFSMELPKVSLFDAGGQAVREITLPIIRTVENNFSTNLAILESALEEVLSLVPRSRVLIAGISVAGIIDFDRGRRLLFRAPRRMRQIQSETFHPRAFWASLFSDQCRAPVSRHGRNGGGRQRRWIISSP